MNKELKKMDDVYFELYYEIYHSTHDGMKAYKSLEEQWTDHDSNGRPGEKRYQNYATFRVMLSRRNKIIRKRRKLNESKNHH